MREVFRLRNFNDDNMLVIHRADKIVVEYSEMGYTVTVRQLYYQMIAQDLFPLTWVDEAYNFKNELAGDTKNTMKNYQKFSKLISEARMAGHIDWDAIEDRLRRTVRNTHWSSHEDILKATVRNWGIDKWYNQPMRVEVMAEKDAVAGILEPICLEHDIPFTACRGYGSQSLFYRKGKEFEHIIETEHKPVCILYFGDHDPSGLDMDRDAQQRMSEFSGYGKDGVTLVRLALSMKQIERKKLPPNPAKSTDSRYKEYQKKFGSESWELDALSPDYLAQVMTIALEELRDEDLWRETVAREDEMRRGLMKRVGLTEDDLK